MPLHITKLGSQGSITSFASDFNVNNSQIDSDFIDESDGLAFDEEMYSDENLPESPDYYEKDVKNQALIQSRVQAG